MSACQLELVAHRSLLWTSHHLPPPSAVMPMQPLSNLVHPASRSAFKAHLDAMGGDTYISTSVQGALLVVRTHIEGHTVIDERSFAANTPEAVAQWEGEREQQEREQAEWMLGKGREEIEGRYGWPEGVSEEEMQSEARRTLGLEQ